MTDGRLGPSVSGGTRRRTFQKVAAGAGTAAGLASATQDDGGGQGEVAGTFEFVGHYTEWLGVSPEAIADQENPTLELEPGQTYEVVWENGDGLPHNFVIVDSQGETQTVEFDATEEMTEYLCEVHPASMRGSVEIVSGGGGGGGGGGSGGGGGGSGGGGGGGS